MSYPESPMLVPEGWPQAQRCRVIAILGWARLSEQGDQGSGYNLSASELATGLVCSGHRVLGLASGMRYSPMPGIRIEHDLRWRGVQTYNVINSPSVAPAALNFGNLGPESESPKLTSVILKWLEDHRVEIVHIHSLEGYSLDLIRAIRSTGRPIVVTLHNYWFVCPQVDLLRAEQSVCLDYEDGRACETCVHTGAAATKRRRRAVSQVMIKVLGHRATDVVRDALDDVLAMVRGGASPVQRFTPLSRSGVPLDAASGLTPGRARLRPSLPPDTDGIDHESGYERPPADANEQMLENTERHRSGSTRFAKRRSDGVEALNAASAVVSPSRYLRDVHQAMGVRDELLSHIPLGQPHFDELFRVAASSAYYETVPWSPGASRPLRFAFHGTTRANKGLEVLVRALPLLGDEVHARAQFNIRALGHDTPFRRRLAPFANVSFEGQYDIPQLVRASGTYDVGILSHIWLENSPLVMWEHLYAGKLCIAPRLGGSAEVVRDRANGAFFAPGDPEDLARVITEIVQGERPLPSAKQIHDASELHGYPAHVARVASLYETLLSEER